MSEFKKKFIERYVELNNGNGGAYFMFCCDADESRLSMRWCRNLIPKEEVNTIVELGSRDGLDAIWLHKHFNAEVVCWECHPELVEVVKEHIQFFPEVELVDKAVWSERTTLEFNIVVNGNVGASSVFKAKNEQGRPQLEQKTVSVETETLDSWWHTHREGKTIDLLCLDLQGAEIEALKGATSLLPNVKYIITEGCRNPEYEDAPTLEDIRGLLAEYGFQEVANNEGSYYADEHQADYLFSKVGS